jgi:hypothetical protein
MLFAEVPMWMILSVLLSGPVRADALWIPDELCPPGSDWNVAHAYSYCGLNRPEHVDCGFGEVKKTVHLCAEETTHSCNDGRRYNEEPCSFEALEAFSACESDSDCERGSCIPSLDCIKRKPRDNDEEDGAEDGEARDEDRTDDDDGKKSKDADCGCLSGRLQASSFAFLSGLFGLSLLRRLD